MIDAVFRAALGQFSLDVNLSIATRGITALFGPSGSGKTTILRCIAGLERAHGWLKVNGVFWQNDQETHFLPTHQRPLGYVFQEASLFPHLNVQQNLTYGWRRISSAQRRVQMEEAIHLLGIEYLLDRFPTHLSGGERQRVAIARALLTSPELLLMDEPLSALDEKSKAEIIPYLERLHRDLSIPVLYVSHALHEVARLADHVVFLESGQVSATGCVSDIFSRFDLPFARLDEGEVVLDTVVAGFDEAYQLTLLTFVEGAGHLSFYFATPKPLGGTVRIRISARDVSIALTPREDSSILNVLPARVLEMADLDSARQLIKLGIGIDGVAPPAILARITRKSVAHLKLDMGQLVYAQIKSVALAS